MNEKTKVTWRLQVKHNGAPSQFSCSLNNWLLDLGRYSNMSKCYNGDGVCDALVFKKVRDSYVGSFSVLPDHTRMTVMDFNHSFSEEEFSWIRQRLNDFPDRYFRITEISMVEVTEIIRQRIKTVFSQTQDY